jgi:penicillin-binding protein 2
MLVGRRTTSQDGVDAKNMEAIIDAMRNVVEHPRGTAYASGLGAEYSIAGKTGTAQVVAIAQGAKYDESLLNEFQKDHALFVAFAPVEDPKIAVAVIVENGGSGSSAAAPVARKMMDYYLQGEPDDQTDQLSSLLPAPGN